MIYAKEVYSISAGQRHVTDKIHNRCNVVLLLVPFTSFDIRLQGMFGHVNKLK